MIKRLLISLCLFATALYWPSHSSFAEENQETLAATEVYDLRYGETLFHFFQQKYFSAITDLMVAEVRDPIRIQGEDPHLLLGGLYLAYGMHNQASNLFQELLSSDVLPSSHDKAWYYIAKLRYQKGYTPQAEIALTKIKDTLPDSREAERLHLLANVYIKQKKYPKAIEVLKNFSGDPEWEAYALFNLGVALVKAGQLEEGTELLSEVGDLDPFSISHELNALRDKANLALGFAYMRGNRPQDAASHFQRIRLTGPLSNKALLGLGWAYTNQEQFNQALTPWLELQTRKALDTTVQESLIAIPFTIEKLGKTRLAMQHYQTAIEAYKNEINRLEDVMLAVQRGELIQAMRPANLDDETSLPLNSFGLPKSITAPYLNQMMATNTFQEAYKNYQSLLHLQYILKDWQAQLPAYELMLTERRNAYYQKLPEVASDERLKSIAQIQQQRDELAAEVKRIKNENDALALVTEDEEDLLLVLNNVKKSIERLSKNEDMSAETAKYNLLKGILSFQLESEFIPRLWSAQNNLKELDRALEKSRKAKRSLVKAANNAPKFFEGYDQKITWSKQRIRNLLARLDAAIRQQENYIQKLAQAGLIKRRQQLENYHVRARFGIARLYDSLILQKDKQGEQPEQGGESAQ
ncbi:MAG: tetratricopeptide repeat protein [Thioalkalispiraceae bacterium]|jgi:hypothetical protein